ncbi:MAG: hypothetical protein JRC77_07225 [Deltaproteobacteria bacterium]|nr:hypothetical protein [Deltaproteobacteria bacterium]
MTQALHTLSETPSATPCTEPMEVSLVELILTLSEITDDIDEIFTTVDHMVETGSVRLSRRSIDDMMQNVAEA